MASLGFGFSFDWKGAHPLLWWHGYASPTRLFSNCIFVAVSNFLSFNMMDPPFHPTISHYKIFFAFGLPHFSLSLSLTLSLSLCLSVSRTLFLSLSLFVLSFCFNLKDNCWKLLKMCFLPFLYLLQNHHRPNGSNALRFTRKSFIWKETRQVYNQV